MAAVACECLLPLLWKLTSRIETLGFLGPCCGVKPTENFKDEAWSECELHCVLPVAQVPCGMPCVLLLDTPWLLSKMASNQIMNIPHAQSCSQWHPGCFSYPFLAPPNIKEKTLKGRQVSLSTHTYVCMCTHVIILLAQTHTFYSTRVLCPFCWVFRQN